MADALKRFSVLASRHDLTESTRDMVKRGTDDLKKLAGLQASLVSQTYTAVGGPAARRSRACTHATMPYHGFIWFPPLSTAKLTLDVLFAPKSLDPLGHRNSRSRPSIMNEHSLKL